MAFIAFAVPVALAVFVTFAVSVALDVFVTFVVSVALMAFVHPFPVRLCQITFQSSDCS